MVDSKNEGSFLGSTGKLLLGATLGVAAVGAISFLVSAIDERLNRNMCEGEEHDFGKLTGETTSSEKSADSDVE